MSLRHIIEESKDNIWKNLISFDKENNVVGSAYSEDAHVNSLLHRVVAILVFLSTGELVIQKRSDNGKLDHSVGGHVKKGESFDEAVIREAEEQLMLSGPFQPVGITVSSENNQGKQVNHLFMVYSKNVGNEWVFAKTEEVQEVDIYTLDEIVRIMNEKPEKVTMGFISTLNKYLHVHKLPFVIHNVN